MHTLLMHLQVREGRELGGSHASSARRLHPLDRWPQSAWCPWWQPHAGAPGRCQAGAAHPSVPADLGACQRTQREHKSWKLPCGLRLSEFVHQEARAATAALQGSHTADACRSRGSHLLGSELWQDALALTLLVSVAAVAAGLCRLCACRRCRWCCRCGLPSSTCCRRLSLMQGTIAVPSLLRRHRGAVRLMLRSPPPVPGWGSRAHRLPAWPREWHRQLACRWALCAVRPEPLPRLPRCTRLQVRAQAPGHEQP